MGNLPDEFRPEPSAGGGRKSFRQRLSEKISAWVRAAAPVPQAGALPYRHSDEGRVEILLVTSSDGEKWLLPKGMTSSLFDFGETAKKEAYEEAGISGRLAREPLGAYTYRKKSGFYKVWIYALEVTDERDDYPESATRRRQWVSPKEAGRLIKQKNLRRLVKRAAARLAKAGRN